MHILFSIMAHIILKNEKIIKCFDNCYCILLKETMYHFDSIHEKRKQQLALACDNLKYSHSYLEGSSDQNAKRNFLLDRNHNVFVCRVEKIGSKFIVSFLQQLEKNHMQRILEKEKNNFVREQLIARKLTLVSDLPHISYTDMHYSIIKSFKFMFVREPYGKLVSGYVDKFLMPNTLFWSTVGRYAYKIQHGTDIKCGHNLSFPDFLRYVVYVEHIGEHTNRHFTSINDHCRPCDIPYDFIGKMETFKDDFKTLMDTWNNIYDTNVTFGDFESETAYDRAMFYSKRLFGMKSGIEKCVSFMEGMKRTWIGLQIQGIVSKYSHFPFSKSDVPDMNLERFQKAVSDAIKTITDKAAVNNQKHEAVVEAYSLVPLRDVISIRELVRTDCKLFGYDDSPNFIFEKNKRRRNISLQYFKTFH
ncbi:carbohydrate sulfotransferase 8-like [Argopecten irradians]|uniref:carbohydrate sulfotransferase 8-like n=1 Tax=Argopecten irradians TaxID=31199 RepID=UPI00371D3511